MVEGADVPWDRLFHAYGPATDTMRYLDALRRGDDVRPSSVDDGHMPAYSFLWSCLYTDGRLTPATAPALRWVARAIAEPDFGGSDPTLREGVVWLFREVARTVCEHPDLDEVRRIAAQRWDPGVETWLDGYLVERRSIFEWTDDDAPGAVLLAAALVDCFELLPEVFAAVEPLLATTSSARLRQVAASAAAMLVRHPDLAEHGRPLLEFHLEQAGADDPYHRASMLIGVGELGGEPRAWLTDRDAGVRVCAALAPALATDPEAVAVLVSASRHPRAFERAFGTMVLPQLGHHLSVLVEAVCERVPHFEPLLDSAVAAVPFAPEYLRVDGQWVRGALCEPYLRKAYPDGLPAVHAATPAQRAFARALIRDGGIWDGGLSAGDPAWAASLDRTGLPLDRAAWLALAEA